ncbi:MAG: NYN domain-containing protein [Actinobacteria bacterium]|nr:NYN domain-containing protein [Actinomycetota bacterium]
MTRSGSPSWTQAWDSYGVTPRRPPGLVGVLLGVNISQLRTVVIIDYQNLHLVGAGLFEPFKQRHECLVHPVKYAEQVLLTRNHRLDNGEWSATLSKVLVYRGLPSSKHEPKLYARNQAQKSEWERDRKVKVTLRPLKYKYERMANGEKAIDEKGAPIVLSKSEKGIDVLCALALVREAQNPDVDLVILASQDTDLEPALNEALILGKAIIETSSWHVPNRYRSREIRPAFPQKIRNTKMDKSTFLSALDSRDYDIP